MNEIADKVSGMRLRLRLKAVEAKANPNGLYTNFARPGGVKSVASGQIQRVPAAVLEKAEPKLFSSEEMARLVGEERKANAAAKPNVRG